MLGTRLLESGDNAQHCHLAATRRPEEGHELAPLDGVIEILNDGNCAKGFSDMLEIYGNGTVASANGTRTRAQRRATIAAKSPPD
jgi:hypothetical protein